MFELALKAGIPIIGVHTDDPLNVKEALRHYSGKQLQGFPTKNLPVYNTYLYFTHSDDVVTTEAYERLVKAKAQLVLLNPAKADDLVFDAGVLPTPPSFVQDYLRGFVEDDRLPELMRSLAGLSLKTVGNVVQLTMARAGNVLPSEIRHTRMLLGNRIPGLDTVDTDYDFYLVPKQLESWVNLNESYFLNTNVPQKLVPRGILLSGPPGVGKTMAAFYIARNWKVPLFHMNIASSLNRYLGTSEERVSESLRRVDENAPAILLLDEIEKLFQSGNDEGTISRLLSQLLWWLEMHRSRVLTIMTCNNLDVLPESIYRHGRIDRTIEISALENPTQTQEFAVQCYKNIMGDAPTYARKQHIFNALKEAVTSVMVHSAVRDLVSDVIKTKGWALEKIE